jgi:hypothetical protein
MGRIRGWVKRLERASREEFIEIPQADGTVKRFATGRDGELWGEVFIHEYERGRRHYEGEDPASLPAHPVVEALRSTSDTDLATLMSEHGTILGHWLGEDEIIRGLRERPGPPVRETSPGCYE